MTNREKFKRVFGDIPAQKIFDSQWWDQEYQEFKCKDCSHYHTEYFDNPWYGRTGYDRQQQKIWHYCDLHPTTMFGDLEMRRFLTPSNPKCLKFELKGEDHGNES